MDKLKENLNRRIEHCKNRVAYYKKKHGPTPSLKFTYHGGYSLGYWEGKLSGYEETLDRIEEMEKSSANN